MGFSQSIAEDPLLFMPGSQPGSLNRAIEPVSQCMNCHSGYDAPVEPGGNWEGSMMAHSARDPLWLATLVVAGQDSLWALGTTNAADLCIRCHSPSAWLGGRSDPPNLTAFAVAADFQGVNCDVCHRMVDPMTELNQPDVPPETTSAGISAANTTRQSDWNNVLRYLKDFHGAPLYDTQTRLPVHHGLLPEAYSEATSGQYYILPGDKVKRGNRYDSDPKSKSVEYSRYHRSATNCATCHDVSNPVLANLVEPGASTTRAAASYFHVERTWSEFASSAYGQPGGAPTTPEFAASTGITHVSSCMDCHMPKAVGKAADKNVATRQDLAVHDLTGGNTWVIRMLATADTNGPVYDPYNRAILSGNKYPGARINLDGVQGRAAQLLAGERRARNNLRNAAALKVIADHTSGITLRIQNNTGHRLISGFPEGRRMWLNIEFFNTDGDIIDEVNPYLPLVAGMVGGQRVYESGGDLMVTRDDLVFEAKMSSDLTGELNTFHFVLATDRYKDNRIPPRGYNVDLATSRMSMPKYKGFHSPDYFTEEEFAGGHHDVLIHKPAGAAGWRARLFYQTTSKDYIEFLRDQSLGLNRTLREPAPSGLPTAYVAQDHPFFTTIKDWGVAMYDLWLNNGGSPPELMQTIISSAEVVGADYLHSGFVIRFQTLPGRRYQVQYSPDLSPASWFTLGDPIVGDGAVAEVPDPEALSLPHRFYRVESSQITP